MDNVNDFFATLSSCLWGWPMIILLLGTHIFLTIRLRFPQRKIITAIRLSVQRDKSQKGDVSQFGALATALAATIGTGNIIGVATAVALGGPGAVFWCWLTGVFGISTKYSEALLAIKYRVKSKRGTMQGGPMYTLERGLGWRKMGILFALFTAIAAFGIGCTVQANAISTIMHASYGISTEMSGGVLMLLAAAVIIGGVRSISKVCSMLVPFMALLYVVGCIYILCVNASYVAPALKLIVCSAFSPDAAGGGFAGASVIMAARYGIARGLFSNESGLGSAPIAAAAAKTEEPVEQGLVSMTGTFIDTIIICTLTGLSIIVTGGWSSNLNGATLTQSAFSSVFGNFGVYALTISLILFAFTTILGWCYYGERCFEFLFGVKAIPVYRIVFVAMVALGGYISLETIWVIADIVNGLMAIPNLIALLALSPIIIKETKHYFDNH